ncbi:MAG: Flp pilus assembly complex ATPase component TadA [Thermoguttaceae bacterium]|nr:Flp pilus assembly complex ATPase component TadA [Thermoguttaceae bacterium]MBQ2039410.1 Flp pilus assembly complex ATPase component TadA [Thermoguttaceae bacterium]MBQ4202065.1 Flp pilus assembly complex ATPase component TadA [Thermoguttaceae bacterium]MBQ5367916.1 Flp pilus assembly complex ATPase component TadA [Thermoguttaceae bacterium]MBR6387574.1 Flp pilus assembly complex ATPase component TadA [Thermoguttaceae bacterium]
MARSFGQVLIDLGFIDEEQLDLLREEQEQRQGELLGQIAISMNMITEEQVAQALAEQNGLQVVAVSDLTIPKEVLNHLTEPMANLYRVIPLSFRNDVLTIATADPQNISVMDELRNFLGYQIRVVVTTPKEIDVALERYYATDEGDSVESLIENMKNDKSFMDELEESANGDDLTSAEALAESAPVRKLLNMVFLLGIKDHASDLHFEPFEDEFKIRIKADGTLYEMVPPPRHLASAITTRIKVLANLDIAEKRLPQDGRIRLMVAGNPIDFRVSVLPTMFGESVVCRILDKSVISLDLNNVGMSQELIQQFRETISIPNGIILVTGPTGSGKTTTLYAALSELNVITDKLMTTEDPVEYDIDGIIQMPIDAEIGNTFAQCLRSILRQDPDKILVGEIRDRETAQIAVQASLTGHLVFSTLHTNDAPSTITRLKDMGIPEFLITATLQAILAQRLVRRICKECRTEIKPTEEQLAELGLKPEDCVGKHFYQGAGCVACNNTGYKGRTAIHEFLRVNEEIRDIVLRNGSVAEMREAAQRNGMITLREAGLDKIFEGTTTIEEVVRETVLDA